MRIHFSDWTAQRGFFFAVRSCRFVFWKKKQMLATRADERSLPARSSSLPFKRITSVWEEDFFKIFKFLQCWSLVGFRDAILSIFLLTLRYICCKCRAKRLKVPLSCSADCTIPTWRSCLTGSRRWTLSTSHIVRYILKIVYWFKKKFRVNHSKIFLSYNSRKKKHIIPNICDEWNETFSENEKAGERRRKKKHK